MAVEFVSQERFALCCYKEINVFFCQIKSYLKLFTICYKQRLQIMGLGRRSFLGLLRTYQLSGDSIMQLTES